MQLEDPPQGKRLKLKRKYQRRIPKEEDQRHLRKGIRKGFDATGGVICQGCFKKQCEIDRLKEENRVLKQRILGREKALKTQGVFGLSTPSSQVPCKTDSSEESRKKQGGAKPGHKGYGRRKVDPEQAHEIIESESLKECPHCQVKLQVHDIQHRSLIEVRPIKAHKILYRYRQMECPACFKRFSNRPPALSRSLYGNQLLAQAAVMHFFHGVSQGRIREILGSEVKKAGLIQAFHRLGQFCEKAMPQLIEDFRNSPVKHADETGWRTDGESGYAWIFCTPQTSILQCRDNRSAKVARSILGEKQIRGVLVVDRYGAYNKTRGKLQYCYAHLLRDVESLEEEFEESQEVKAFSAQMVPLLAQAMKLRNRPISDREYYKQASQLQAQLKAVIEAPAEHLGIRRIQGIFLEKEKRLYHWVKDRNVPAENNQAERELRPLVMARKVSFGSQSEQGARTRSSVTSVLRTAHKRLAGKQPLELWLKQALDQIAQNKKTKLSSLLPRAAPLKN